MLYFHPKHSTPGCTTQGAAFRDLHANFTKANCQVFGISRDSLESHQAFKATMNMYGRKVRGIARSTFLVDEKRGVAREWRGVKVKGHVQEVLNFAKAL